MFVFVCVGVFIFGKGGFLDNKVCIIYWWIVDYFMVIFFIVKLDVKVIVVNGEGVIIVGGRMVWIDFVFEIILILSLFIIVLNFFKEMVVDIGYRE